MAYEGILKDIRICVDLGIPERIPMFGIAMPFNIKMAGITHSQYTNDIDLMTKTEVDSVLKYDYDWAIPFSDDFLEIEPLGVVTKQQENIPIAAVKYLDVCHKTVKNLRLPDFTKTGRMQSLLEVQRNIKTILKDKICLTGHIAAPFTAVSLLFGTAETLMLIHNDKQLLNEMIGFCTELEIGWAQAQLDAGADAIWLGDCVASSSFISPGQFEEFAAEPAKKICESIKRKGGFVFYHSSENSIQHLKLAAQLGFSAINIGEVVDIAEVKKQIGDKVCVMGNINPIEVLWQGSSKDVEKETKRIIDAAGKNGGFIFNSAEGIVMETPEENIKTMINTVKSLGKYPINKI